MTEDSLRDEVTQIFVTKLNQFNITTALDLTEFVLEIEYAILNYCNISAIPERLKYTWANMCVDLLRWVLAISSQNSSASVDSAPKISGDVSSIKSGDTTVSFSSSDSSSSGANPKNAHSVKAGVDGIILNYADQLNKFRRMEWF
jgi:hypothetical protein